MAKKEKIKKEPVWAILVDREIFEDRKTAESWVMAGKVLADNVRIDKSGQLVPVTADIAVKGIDQKYVGKGGLKLEGALSDFGIDVNGVVALDAGASTGGFTDCLLQHGAAKVYAVDAGFGRLAGKLHVDPRVVAMERVNIGDLKPEQFDPRPTLVTADLSYLSLKKAIPEIAQVQGNKGELICLVKPIFEVPDSTIRRTGIIDDVNVYRDLLKDLARFVDESGYMVAGITYSHITGNKGAREFFIWVCLDPASCGREKLAEEEIDARIEDAIDSVMKIEVYKKIGR